MLSRFEEAEKAGGKAVLPPVLEGRHLIKALRDLHFASSTGFGLAPLPYTEITSYAKATGGLSGPEIVAIRKMSEAYVRGRNRGVDPFDLGPWPIRDEEGNVIPEDDPELSDWDEEDANG